MGNRFNGVAIGAEGVGKQHFAVSGGAASCDFKLAAGFLISFAQGAQCLYGNINGLAFIGGVERIDKFALFVEQGELVA